MKNNRIMWLVYVLLGLVILAPLLAPGYILTLDMVFVPHPPLPTEIGSSYLFHAALSLVSHVIPGDVLQKIILFSIVLFSGIGMHKLALNNFGQVAGYERFAAYVAGILYVVNPFVYGRFMAGQYAVLLGYMLLPFFVRALLDFLKNPTVRQVLPVVGFTLAISIVSIHTLGSAIVLMILALSLTAWRKRHSRAHLSAILRYGGVGVLIVAVLSSYWLLPLVQGQGTAAEQIDNFNSVDRAAFATDGGLLQVLQLQGFWVEAQGLFMSVGDLLPLTGLMQILLWALVVTGIVSLWRQRRDYAVLWSSVAVSAIVLALGTPVSSWLVENVPLFAGYREPHKFVALLALSYAVFAAYGTLSVLKKLQGRRAPRYAFMAGILILPFWITPTMVWGFSGQLAPKQYPADWYAAERLLNNDEDTFKVLFLPWHLYMQFDFAGRIIAHPADKFFDHSVVVSRDPEFAGLKPTRQDSMAQSLGDDILPSAPHASTLGARLAPLRIKYVLLAKDGDYREYSYLEKQHDLQLVSETENLKIYRNEAYRSEVR